jgi:chemotaxis protein CheY-P-specific phosphatase CheC
MSNTLQLPLSSAAATTFEELGFLFGVPMDPREAPRLDTGVRVAFHGPREGCLEVRVAEPVLAAIAANMLGTDEPPAPELQRDALGEVANVICGNVVPALDGARAVYLLDAPVHLDDLAPACGEPDARIVLSTDEGHADVRLYLHARPSAA